MGDVPETETEPLVAKFPSTFPIFGDRKDLHRHPVPQSCGVKTDKSPQNGPHRNGICYKFNMLYTITNIIIYNIIIYNIIEQYII